MIDVTLKFIDCYDKYFYCMGTFNDIIECKIFCDNIMKADKTFTKYEIIKNV